MADDPGDAGDDPASSDTAGSEADSDDPSGSERDDSPDPERSDSPDPERSESPDPERDGATEGDESSDPDTDEPAASDTDDSGEAGDSVNVDDSDGAEDSADELDGTDAETDGTDAETDGTDDGDPDITTPADLAEAGLGPESWAEDDDASDEGPTSTGPHSTPDDGGKVNPPPSQPGDGPHPSADREDDSSSADREDAPATGPSNTVASDEPSSHRSDGGAGAAGAADEVPGYEPQEVPTGGGVSAPDDEEMPLADHIEEMVIRLGWVIGAMVVVGAVAFPVADRLINFLWYSFLPGTVEQCPRTGDLSVACPFLYDPLALMFARLKISGLIGFVAALPVLVYQSYLFMRPGLYPRERRYYLASVPTSLLLAGLGMAFAYFLVLPTLFVYFTDYSAEAADIAFGLTETFNLIVMMLGFFALIFQIPLFIMLAVMMGVASRRWLARRRIYFWGGFATIAFIFSPDPTGMAPILVAVTMIALFEGTLLLLYWTGEASAFATPESLAARRPFVWLGAALAGYLASTAPLPDTYYDQLPAAFTSALADLGTTRLTPLVVGGALILVYELLLFAYRRVRGRDRLRRALARARVFVWPASLLVGYFGSPDPVLLRRVDAVDLSTAEAAGLTVGLIVAYELLIASRRWLRGR